MSLRSLLDAATKGPWAWYRESDIVVLGTAGSEAFDGHVLTSSICPACFERGGRCTTPTDDNAALIVALVNLAPQLVEWAEAFEAYDALPRNPSTPPTKEWERETMRLMGNAIRARVSLIDAIRAATEPSEKQP